MSDAYAIAGWTLIKADLPASAWIAASRAINAAERAQDALRVAAATRCLSEVHMRAGHYTEATRIGFLAAVHVDASPAGGTPAGMCLRGAALLSASAASARRGDAREARAALRSAADWGGKLDIDRADLGTVFGPTNVAIHRVAVAIELGDAREADRHVPSVNIDKMPALLTERRARYLIDVARTKGGLGDDRAALDALGAAEAIAADEVRSHRLTHALLRELLPRERRASPLRALAARCNVEL